MPEDRGNYWNTIEGLTERCNRIAGDFVFRVTNRALAFYGDNNYSGLQWTGYLDSKTCEICEPNIKANGGAGRIYQTGQYVPPLPAHPYCRCNWRLILNPELYGTESMAKEVV